MRKILVFDLGASSGRAMLCRVADGRLVLDELSRFKNEPITIDGHLCWNFDALFSEIREAVRLADKVGVNAISIDTWGVDYGLVGRDGRLLSAPVCYRDDRTIGVESDVFRRISKDSLYGRTGIQHGRINTLFQLYADMKENPDRFLGAESILMMPDLIAAYLTGTERSEFTEATTTSLVSAATGDWDDELIKMLGFPRRLFKPIIHPGELCGYLKPEFTDRRVPVIAAPSHDTAAAALAVPSTEKDYVFISCGTWALFGTEIDAPICSERANRLGLTNEGSCGGKTMLLKNIMGTWLLQECRRYYEKRNGSCSFAELESAARAADYSDALINPNDELFVAPGRMPEKIVEYCRRTNQTVSDDMGAVARVIYESLTDVFAKTLRSVEEITDKHYPVIHLFGGGSVDRLLAELTEKKTARRVIAGPTEATALGNAANALIAIGEIDSVEKAREMIAKGLSL